MSSIVPAGSDLPVMPAELRDPWRPTDLRFSVRLRSARKLGWPELPFGDVGGGGESGGGSGVLLLRRTSVGGAVFLSELFPQVELLTRERGGGGGGAWGWGFTTATRGGPPLWASLPGAGGGGKRSEAGGGGGKKPVHSGGGDGKSPLVCFTWLTLAWSANGRLDRLSLPGFGGAGGPDEGSLEGDPVEGHGEEGGAFLWEPNLLSKFLLDSS